MCAVEAQIGSLAVTALAEPSHMALRGVSASEERSKERNQKDRWGAGCIRAAALLQPLLRKRVSQQPGLQVGCSRNIK